MALRFYCGCGLYYTTLTDKWDGTVASNATPSVDTGANGRWGGRCISFVDGDFNAGTSSSAAVYKDFSGGLAEYVVQLAVNISTLNVGEFPIVSFYEGATLHCDLRFTFTNSTFTVTRNGTVLGTSSNNAWSTAGGWKYLKIRVKVHDTTGTITVVYDGVTIFSLSGLDTRNGATGIIDRIYIGKPASATNGQVYTVRIQDVAVCDVTGSAPMNDIHAEGRVRLLQTAAEGDVNEWTPSTGTDNEALVDEIPNNGNTDYNSTSTVNHRDLFTADDLPVTPTTIFGVAIHNMVAKDDAGTDTAASMLKTNGTEYVNAAAVGVTGATFQKVNGYWELNPDTAAAWTKANVDGLQIGIKRTA